MQVVEAIDCEKLPGATSIAKFMGHGRKRQKLIELLTLYGLDQQLDDIMAVVDECGLGSPQVKAELDNIGFRLGQQEIKLREPTDI